ncbi:CHASE sensor domain-containing protein [Thiocystis violacea]|uniref:CHASE sensor domain-containing protein n=1 Tax=Thiocystis violacea TaxID=13725 RepID=UPI0019037DCD|nr:CHASE sensor domain-containing protein [Thiocystis violacea]MBK1718694.1 hypothetical protein [Thiocystis violacea]
MIPRRLRSIRTRLLVALMSMTLLTLSMATILSAAMDLKLFRDHLLRDLRVLAAVVGDNCTSALVFNSPETAERYLATLAREYQIREAVLENAAGQTFVDWRPEPETTRGAEPWTASARGRLPGSTLSEVEIVQPLLFDGRLIGRLVLHVRLDELLRQFWLYVLFGGLLALLTLGVTFVVAVRLQGRIARPILRLTARTREISRQREIAPSAAALDSTDELATLVHDFEAMLQRIEEREEALRQHVEALDGANAKLRALAMDLARLEATEKRRLAGELHDSPMQKLALAQLQIASGAQRDGADEESRQQLDAGLDLMREAIEELRTLQFELSPPILHQKGLAAALDWLATSTQARWGIRLCGTIDPNVPEPGWEASAILFQCARELVYNLIKHSGATQGAIRARVDSGELVILIEDNGRGVGRDVLPAPAGDRTGYGLYSVRERLELLGGTLELTDRHPGTLAAMRLPLSALSGMTGAATETDRAGYPA